jgi:hypothetical protein
MDINQSNIESYNDFNPYIFYEHQYDIIAPLISKNNEKQSEFISNCLNYKDDDNNNILHYIFFQLDKYHFTKRCYNICKWILTQNRINLTNSNGKYISLLNVKNKNNNNPFYYYLDYWISKKFVSETNLNEVSFIDGFNLFYQQFHLDLSIPNNFNDNIFHILCHYSNIYEHKDIENILYIPDLIRLYKCKNNNKQYPLHIAMSSFQNKDNINSNILNYIFHITFKLLPLCITSTDYKGRNIYHLSLEYNQKHIFEYIINCNNSEKLVATSINVDDNSNRNNVGKYNMPNVFILLINKNKELTQILYNKYPKLFLAIDNKQRTIFHILYEFYLLNKDNYYIDTFEIFSKQQYIINNINLSKDTIDNLLLNMKLYKKYGNYFCHICLEGENSNMNDIDLKDINIKQVDKDIRDWEKPYICKSNHNNHPDKLIHLSCMKKWLTINEELCGSNKHQSRILNSEAKSIQKCPICISL